MDGEKYGYTIEAAAEQSLDSRMVRVEQRLDSVLARLGRKPVVPWDGYACAAFGDGFRVR